MADLFTSDTHFGHVNIITYCSRPFRDVEEMNRSMIERWNARVRSEDTVFHLGDFAMGKKDLIPTYLKALNGYKILILGNHDRSAKSMREAGFDEVHEVGIYQSPVGEVLLRHHPDLDFDLAGRFKLMLNGHVHERWCSRTTVRGGLLINVGVDQNDFQPISFEEALHRSLRPGVFDLDKLLQCRVCPRTVAPTSKFIDGCPKCGSRETAPFVYGEPG
jgi:calcineurin-like phosphoesterase family protein